MTLNVQNVHCWTNSGRLTYMANTYVYSRLR